MVTVIPIVLALALVLHRRRERRSATDTRVRGAWLVLVALVVAVSADRLRPGVDDPMVINRLEATSLCLIAAGFAYLNLSAAPGVRRAAALVTAGVWANALGVLAFGYMPVLARAAAIAGHPFTAHNPSPGYVRSEDLNAFGILIGDFIPLPHLLKVLSIGDVALLVGLAMLLYGFLGRAFATSTRTVASKGDSTRELAGGGEIR